MHIYVHIYIYLYSYKKDFQGIAVLHINTLTSSFSYVLCMVNVYDVFMCAHTYGSQRPLCLPLAFVTNYSVVGSLTEPQIYHFRNAVKSVNSCDLPACWGL